MPPYDHLILKWPWVELYGASRPVVQSWKTKKMLVEMGGVDYLIPHLTSTEWVSQMYAAAAVQNMSQNLEFTKSFVQRGALKSLRNLLRSTQPIVVRFAAGALKTARPTISAANVEESRRRMGKRGRKETAKRKG